MEEQRKTYYISLAKREVSEANTPEMEYEVYATATEMVKFEALMNANDDNEFFFAVKNLPFKPFAEREVEGLREETHDNNIHAYEFLYKFGTEETREKLKEIGYDN